MKKITQLFNNVIKQLNEQGTYPIIYGSFGLHLKTGWTGKINDLDFLINRPKDFDICKKILLKDGFKIDPNHTRELIKNNFYVSFIDKKDIEKLISEPLRLSRENVNGCKFYNLALAQYKKIYINGLKNKYRKEKKEKKDSEKIKYIEKI